MAPREKPDLGSVRDALRERDERPRGDDGEARDARAEPVSEPPEEPAADKDEDA